LPGPAICFWKKKTPTLTFCCYFQQHFTHKGKVGSILISIYFSKNNII